MVGIRSIGAACVSVLLLGAGPASKPAPTTRPAGKAPIPASWAANDNQTYHFRYRIPPQWKAEQKSDSVTVFSIGPKTRVPPARLILMVAPCHATTTEADAADLRKEITAQHPAAKIVEDQSANLGERPAWMIAYDDTLTGTLTRRTGNGPPQVTQVKNPWKVFEMTRVEGNLHYYVTYEGAPAPYAANLPAVQQVLDSFTWSQPPASK